MPALNVGGSTVPVAADGGASRRWEEIGDNSRTANGRYFTTVRARKLVWRIRTAPLSSGEAYALLVTLSCAPPLIAYGTLMPSTNVGVHPELVGQHIVAGGTGPRFAVEFLLHESS